jgi:predicted nucleic acid-binding protein
VNFWDSSAIIPLLIAESRSDEVHGLLQSDPRMTVWWTTIVECHAAIAQGERGQEYAPADADKARARLEAIHGDWNEIAPTEEVRERASTLLMRHALRAADALQLAAALTWARGRPRGHAVLTLDARLGAAARGEGFALPLPTGPP